MARKHIINVEVQLRKKKQARILAYYKRLSKMIKHYEELGQVLVELPLDNNIAQELSSVREEDILCPTYKDFTRTTFYLEILRSPAIQNAPFVLRPIDNTKEDLMIHRIKHGSLKIFTETDLEIEREKHDFTRHDW